MKEGLENSKKLSLFSLFDNLSENEMDLIPRETEVLHFEKGEVVCLEDTDSDSMYFIYDGEVSVSQKGVSIATL